MFCSAIIWKKRLEKTEDFLGRYGMFLRVTFVAVVDTHTDDKNTKRLSVV
jgi:hypothetical protein